MDGVLYWTSIILQNFAETFLLICVFHAFLGRPKKNAIVKYILIAMIAVGYCVVLNMVSMSVYIRYILTFTVFLIYSLFFSGSITKKMFIVLCDFFVTAFFSVSIYWLIDLVAGEHIKALSIDLLLYALPNVIVLTAVGFGILTWGKNTKIENRLPSIQWLMMMLYPGVAFLVIMSLYTISVSPENRHDLMLLDSIALMAVMIVHFVLLYLLNDQNQALERSKLVKQEVQLSKEKAEALLEAYDEQRKMTHDFNNQLNAIRGLLEQGEAEKAKNLVDGILPMICEGKPIINTHNFLIDTMLNQKYTQAKKKGIVVFFVLNDLNRNPIPDPDMVTLIGNLFDNAIEGSVEVKSPEIQVKIQLSEEYFILSFRNRVETEIEFGDSELPLSTKQEEGHGYGLQNVVALFKKNRMDYSISCQKGWFQVSAMKYL